jgi:putative membrane protein
MSDKDFYDEDEIIDSLVNEQTPNRAEDFRENQSLYGNGRSNIHVQQVGCGCFDARKFFTNLFIYSLVLMVTSGLFTGFYIANIPAAIRASFTLTLLNTFVKPFIIFFTLPLTIVTMGLFYLIINGMIIMMTAGMMGEDFVISNFFTAVIAAIFISILQHFIKKHLLKVDQL